ncbi:DUF5958 family protein [Streptomyces sp. NPDC096311]|uniref:DUF5958 family protein n=1 Tax=Streptomyces sp. NPDC096311 TaxID=3366083 RepID=UPI0037FD997A
MTASARAGGEWFEGLAVDEQFEVLRDLSGLCIQARATVEDEPESVRPVGIRPTRTPAMLDRSRRWCEWRGWEVRHGAPSGGGI